MLGAGFIEFLFVVKIISKFIVSTKEIQNNLKPISVLDNLINIFLGTLHYIKWKHIQNMHSLEILY